MPRYASPFTKTGADSVRQVAEVLSSATVQRIRCYAFVIGNTATPADALVTYSMRRVTESATGTATTPNPIDFYDAACRSTAEHLITADAASFNTAPKEVFSAPVNLRATFQFYASDGQELCSAAVSANGISLGMAAVSTSTFAGTIYFIE